MNSNLSENNVKEISTQIKEISREEFLKNFAKQKGISIDEADKIDKAQTQSDYQQELAKHKTSSQLLTSSVSPLMQVKQYISKLPKLITRVAVVAFGLKL